MVVNDILKESTKRPFSKGYLVPERNVGQLILIWIKRGKGEDVGEGRRPETRVYFMIFTGIYSNIINLKKAKRNHWNLCGFNLLMHFKSSFRKSNQDSEDIDSLKPHL